MKEARNVEVAGVRIVDLSCRSFDWSEVDWNMYHTYIFRWSHPTNRKSFKREDVSAYGRYSLINDTLQRMPFDCPLLIRLQEEESYELGTGKRYYHLFLVVCQGVKSVESESSDKG